MLRLSSLTRGGAFLARIASLAGRFVFVLVAAVAMEPTAFGIYGLVATLAFVILQLAGLEAYQVVLRSITSGNDAEATPQRPLYGRFVLVTCMLAFGIAAATAYAFGWSATVILLAAGVIMGEYLGTEITRILVAERRSTLALTLVAARVAPWNFGLPLLWYAGLLQAPWSIEMVLSVWLACSLTGSLAALPVLRAYLALRVGRFGPWYSARLAAAPPWLLVALCWRFLENGVRLVPGIVISEAAAGRFVFAATVASVGAVGIKAAIEPFFFARLVSPETSVPARREFARASVAWLTVGAVLSTTGVALLDAAHFKVLAPEDLWLFAILLLSSCLLALSQIPHFAIYAAQNDAVLFWISAAVLAFSIAVSVALTIILGLIGTGLACVAGAGALMIAKLYAARRQARSFHHCSEGVVRALA